MADNKTTKQQVKQELAKSIQAQIDVYAKDFEELHKRELRSVAKKLKKSNGSLPKTPGLQPVGQMASTNGLQMCTGCGKPHPVGKCMGKSEKGLKKAALASASAASTPTAASAQKQPKAALPGMTAPLGAPAQKPPSTVFGGVVQRSKRAQPALPGMTPPIGGSATMAAGTSEPAPFKAPGPATAAPTSVAQANQELGGFKSLASSPTAMPGGTLTNPEHGKAITGTEKRAAGIGFVGNLVTRIKGTGNKGWEEARGTGPASAARLVATTGRRLALSEKKPVAKATVDEVNREMKGFKSLASNPTAMPSSPGLPKPASFKGAPKAFKKEKSAVAKEEVKGEIDKGLASTNHTRSLLASK